MSYSSGYLTGWNSLKRTGVCTLTTNLEKKISSFDLHLGLNFLVLTFGNLHLKDDDTGVYFRVSDNSLHFGLTFANSTNCTIAFYALTAELFQSVSHDVSNDRFQYYNFEVFFETTVRNRINRILAENSPMFQNFFQESLCDMSNDNPPLRVILNGMQYLFRGF